jgi:hypothetical protein
VLEQRHIAKLLAELRPHARANWLSTLRGLLDLAVAEGLIKENAAKAVKLRPAKTKGHRSWTENEMARFEAWHQIGTKARLALALPLYTALRKSDFLRLGPQHIRDGVLHVTQQKTGGSLQLPIRPELQEIIAATPCNHLTFLVSATGGTYSPNGFGQQFRRWCDDAQHALPTTARRRTKSRRGLGIRACRKSNTTRGQPINRGSRVMPLDRATTRVWTNLQRKSD